MKFLVLLPPGLTYSFPCNDPGWMCDLPQFVKVRLFMAYMLLTGATGLLGGYLLRDALRQELPVAVVVRRTSTLSARRRIDAVLAPFETERALPRPVVLEGDLSKPRLGLADSDVQWLERHCDRVLHSAASISFYREESSNEPYRTNVDGTRNLLDLCRKLSIGEFHHVSTAYVCGRRNGRVLETELEVGQQHGNDYEQSKVAAEKLVLSAGFARQPSIYRPSIIVGDSVTGYTTTYNGFYTPAQIAWLLAKAGAFPEGTKHWFLDQLGLRGDERKNIVPVDWVACVILHLLQNTAAHGRTYHLTCDQPPTAGDLDQAIGEAIRMRLTRGVAQTNGVIAPVDLLNGSDVRKHMDVYRAYFRDHPEFDTSNLKQFAAQLPCPPMNREALVRMAGFAIDANFGWPRTQPPVAPLDLTWRATNEPLSRSPAQVMCVLEITGLGGGAWTFELPRKGGSPSARLVETGRTRNPAATIRLRSDTFSRLVAKSYSVEAALMAGRVLIVAQPGHAEDAAQLLENLIDRQPDPTKTNGSHRSELSPGLLIHGEMRT